LKKHTFIEDNKPKLRNPNEAVRHRINKNSMRRYNDLDILQNGIPDSLLGPQLDLV
jgi:hypothetical protein